jgi:putative phosphonate metabolism protein
MHGNPQGRYALYFAPEERSALYEFGRHWLGRDTVSGKPVSSFSIPGLSQERVRELTESPRHYGFHGTLKPPFHLAEGFNVKELYSAAGSLAMELSPLPLGFLELRWLDTFLALVPPNPGKELYDLAAACVRRLDPFRAPHSGEELARRRASGLTENQERLLARWGYPYVMEEFRFHLTLTGPMKDSVERDCIFSSAEPLTRSIRNAPTEISSLCIFEQKNRATPFRLTHRFPLQGRSPSV